ncbi:PP2C family protein-serine/threonine phosphatase [Silvibacterium sp.]|uniref:PP2C family protein-serine/threonine phosphatase n=1 Tax=Silvibacterium sp. TaxID=1964179 RepID=UPI0039E463D4
MPKRRPPRSSRLSPAVLRVLIALFVLAGLGYWLAFASDSWEYRLHRDRHVAQPLDFDDDSLLIDSVRPEAQSAGLRIGLRITGFNGAPYSGLSQWTEIEETARPGDTLDVEFDRTDGSHSMATLAFTPLERENPGVANWVLFLREVLLNLALPLVCLGIGCWVAMAKPQDKNAWLVLLMLSFPSTMLESVTHAYGLGIILRSLWAMVPQLGAPPALLLFGIYFPERSRIDERLPWLKWIIVAPITAFAAFYYPALLHEYFVGPLLHLRLAISVVRAMNFLLLACVILFLVFALDKLRSASTADARRRLRVMITGMGTGLFALLLVLVLLPHFGIADSNNPSLTTFWVRFAGVAVFMVAPFTLAYVVLVQRAMDVRVILRAGTRYLLAKAFLLVLRIVLISLAVTWLLVPVFYKKQPQPADLIGVFIFLGLILFLRFVLRDRAQAWLDRRFFREAYNAEVVLNELSDQVRRFTETGPLLETVARKIAETLHVGQVAVLLRRGELFELQQSIGISTSGALALSPQASSVRYLASTNEPARLYRDDPDAWYLMAGMAERDALNGMNAELLLPLPGRNRLMGVMALGPKRSEAAYTRTDMHLLQAVATQTGLAIEISELARSLATEAAQRERVNREIEIAREVQERLFPQTMPELPGATLAGHCRPALGVGGDYYDVFPLSDGRTGLAIGDVSGKGIAAALLMASLRASLRGVTLDNPRDFARLMDKVNRLVYEASASNRYATFFFAAYDPATRRLECVNAGHNPPLIIRRNPEANGAHTVIRLEAGGPVVGLLPFAPYTEQTVTLEPGDLVLLYTDGISEAMTPEDEEWGEDRLIEAADCCWDKSAGEILDHLFHDADAFTRGAPQHDDMTLLVLKLGD